jgi:hypothetical protein
MRAGLCVRSAVSPRFEYPLPRMSLSVRQWTLVAAQGLTSSFAETVAGGVASSIDAGIAMFR